MSGFLTSYLGSVNRWECDENDHLNVRFFVSKAQQAIGLAMAQMGILPATEAASALLEARRLHIRFLQEARTAAPLQIDVGIVGLDRRSAQAVAVMKHRAMDSVHATFIADLVLATLPGARPTLVTPPEYALPRGLPSSELAEHELSHAQALAVGFRPVGAGLIALEECGASGWMDPAHFMGRISDGMPNLWSLINSPLKLDTRQNLDQGNAVLEFRMDFHGRLRSGDGYHHLAGIVSLGDKTIQLAHLLFDAATERCVLSAEAISTTLDLNTRKSVSINPERRAALAALRIKR